MDEYCQSLKHSQSQLQQRLFFNIMFLLLMLMFLTVLGINHRWAQFNKFLQIRHYDMTKNHLDRLMRMLNYAFLQKFVSVCVIIFKTRYVCISHQKIYIFARTPVGTLHETPHFFDIFKLFAQLSPTELKHLEITTKNVQSFVLKDYLWKQIDDLLWSRLPQNGILAFQKASVQNFESVFKSTNAFCFSISNATKMVSRNQLESYDASK